MGKFFGVLFFVFIPCISFCQLEDESLFDKANRLFKEEKWEQGKVILEEGIADSPEDSDLLMLLGKYYHVKGQNDQARFHLLKAIQIDPQNTDAKQILINVDIVSEHYSSAICYVNELLEVNPYWKGLWQKKIQLFRLQGNDEEANRLSKRLMQIYPEDQGLKDDFKIGLQNEINRLRREGSKSEALQRTEDLIKIDGKNPELYTELINTFIAASDYKNALIYVDRALEIFPDNIIYIKKKAAILSEMGDHGNALRFVQSKMGNNSELRSVYNQMQIKNARFQNSNDPYTLYGKIYERDPNNREALTFLLNTSLSRGYYYEAEMYLQQAKKKFGETKDLLYKELMLYRKTGSKPKENKVINRLFELYPEEEENKAQYFQNQYENAKLLIADNQISQATVPLYVIVNGEQNAYKEKSYQLLVDLYLEIHRDVDANNACDTLLMLYPTNIDNHFRKVKVLRGLGLYEEAIVLYEEILKKFEKEIERADYEYGYLEISFIYVKELMNKKESQKANEVLDCILEIDPKSDLAYRYAINNSFHEKNFHQALYYSEKATNFSKEDVFFQGKMAESYIYLQKYEEASLIIDSILPKYPNDPYLINLKTDLSIDSIQILRRLKLGEEIVEIADQALLYNPENKYLKYHKGVGYQIMLEYDSAYKYQLYYEPTVEEEADYGHHLIWLKYKSYENQLSFFHLRSRVSDNVSVNSISTIEYLRTIDAKNTLITRLNYTGRDLGVGVLGQLEWFRAINKKYYFKLNGSYSTRYFQKYSVKLNLYKSLRNDFEWNVGVGYRELPGIYSLTNLELGLSKFWEHIWLNPTINVYLDQQVTYNVLMNSKFFIFKGQRSFIQSMASFGSIPDGTVLDLSLYQEYNALNTMVALGGQYAVNSKLALGVLGNWYNSKVSATSYQNLYNTYIQVFYSF